MAESMFQSSPAAPILTPCSRGPRKQSSSSSDSISMSPEFEFWMVRNPPILPQPKLLSADELFSDGTLLPLYRLHQSPVNDPTDPNQETTTTGSGSDHGEDSSGLTMVGKNAASRSWKDIFKKNDGCKKIEKGNKKEMKNHDSAGVASNNTNSHRIRSAELININIWPFSRSRSAGNGGIRPSWTSAGKTRKVSSAPCSRSNSIGGEFKSRKWSASPTQGTEVQVSKNTPVPWQVWRGGGAGGSGRRATDLVGENARNGLQTKDNELAGNGLPPA